MTEAAAEEGNVATLPSKRDADWLLEQIVAWGEVGVRQDIVLAVGGALITGELISGRLYLEVMARRAEGGKASAGAETLPATIANFYRGLVPAFDRSDRAPAGSTRAAPVYIHLQNARFLSGNGSLPQSGGVLWRGRLSCVDGFALGGIPIA